MKKIIISESGSWNNKIKLSQKTEKFMKKNVIVHHIPLKKKSFKIEILSNCKVCGKKLGRRQRTFCSPTCRNKNNYQKNKVYQAEYQARKKDELAEIPSSNKIRCLICGRWYVQIGSHVVQKHGMTAREYREEYGFDVKKGQLPAWYKKIKGNLALENGTYKNVIKSGKKYWFKKGQEGVGIYKRSEETLKRLSKLYKYNKHGRKI